MAVDAASFVVSFLSLLAIDTHEDRPARQSDDDGRPTSLRAEIAEGLRFVWREPRIRSVAASTGTSNLFSTMIMAVMLLFLRRELHLSAGHIGVLLAFGGVGGILGALVAARLASLIGVGRAILWTIVVCGLGQLAYPLANPSNVNLVIAGGGLLGGAGGVAYNINQVSLRQALCPLPLQGRMNASVRFMVWGTMPLGGLIGGVLGGSIGLRPTLWVAGIGSLSAFLWILLSPVPSVRTMPTQIIDLDDPDPRTGPRRPEVRPGSARCRPVRSPTYKGRNPP